MTTSSDGLLPLACPTCGRDNEYHTPVTPDAQLKPGDVCVCYRCLTPAIAVTVNGALMLRMATPTEEERIKADVRGLRESIKDTRYPHEAIQLFRDSRKADT